MFSSAIAPLLGGRLVARSLSSSREIFRGSRANKVGLSSELDKLLFNHHDMRLFGLGFLAEVSSVKSYVHATASRLRYYTAMEARFDCAESGAITHVWPLFSAELRRSERLANDLRAVGVDPAYALRSPALDAYVTTIEKASDDDLVGHLYTRYFADMFGGSMLGHPTKLALGLPMECAAYGFAQHVRANRGEYIESVYAAINAAGETLTEEQRRAVVEESRRAFSHNAELVKERSYAVLLPQAALGVVNLLTGYARHFLLPTQIIKQMAERLLNRRL
ncbi:hypothetical protein T492DRAFT_1002978 [Pavlovales sp. CCMP2436]|nr:hypothetical protein T492DRAFT_1002978 [Pavlovales sp. CCMP2436]